MAAPKVETEEVDPLDAFMASNETSMKEDKPKDGVYDKATRDDLEEEDDMVSFLKFKKAKEAEEKLKEAGLEAEYDREFQDAAGAAPNVEYDSDDMPIVKGVDVTKDVDPLPALDHSKIEYPEFCKVFYTEPEELAKLTPGAVNARRAALGITVVGFDCPNTVERFDQLQLGPVLMQAFEIAHHTS